MSDPTTDDSLQRLKESYLEVRAPASTASAARERFAASKQSRGWHPGWVVASLLLAAMLIPIAVDRSPSGTTPDLLTLPARDFAFPGLSVIDLPVTGVLSIQRPSLAIEAPQPTPIPPPYRNEEVYL